MTPKLFAVAALAGTIPYVAPPLLSAPPTTRQQVPFKEHWEALVGHGRKRTNWVLMTAKVKEHETDKLVVEWGFDYTGPRQPLTILSPVRPDSKDLYPLASAVSFYAVGADGFPYEENYATPPRFPYDTSWQRPEYFLTVEKGKRATVEVTVPIAEILNRFKDREKYPTQFIDKPTKLYFRLVHKPEVRGERLDLDAWTGSLVSEPILLDLKSW